MRGCAPDSAVPKIPAQAGIHLPPSPEALEEGAGDGPLPPQGPAGGEGKPLSPQSPHPRRMPGPPALRARSQPQETPASAGDTEERGNLPNPVIPESASRLSGALRRNEANALHSPRFEGQANALHSPREGPGASAGRAAAHGEMGSGEKGGDRPRLNPPYACVRNDRHGNPVGRVTTRQCGAHGLAGYAPLIRPTGLGSDARRTGPTFIPTCRIPGGRRGRPRSA